MDWTLARPPMEMNSPAKASSMESSESCLSFWSKLSPSIVSREFKSNADVLALDFRKITNVRDYLERLEFSNKWMLKWLLFSPTGESVSFMMVPFWISPRFCEDKIFYRMSNFSFYLLFSLFFMLQYSNKSFLNFTFSVTNFWLLGALKHSA